METTRPGIAILLAGLLLAACAPDPEAERAREERLRALEDRLASLEVKDGVRAKDVEALKRADPAAGLQARLAGLETRLAKAEDRAWAAQQDAKAAEERALKAEENLQDLRGRIAAVEERAKAAEDAARAAALRAKAAEERGAKAEEAAREARRAAERESPPPEEAPRAPEEAPALEALVATLDSEDVAAVEAARDALKKIPSREAMEAVISSLPAAAPRSPPWQQMQKLDVIRWYVFRSDQFDPDKPGEPDFGYNRQAWLAWWHKVKGKIRFFKG